MAYILNSGTLLPGKPPSQVTPLSFSEKKRFLETVARFKKARILVIGDFILDQFIWGSVDRISPEAPVPVVNVQRESYMPGGSLNVANNIHTLGGVVFPCGVIGRDINGRMLAKVMRKSGIETAGVIYDPARPTSIKTRVIAHSQQMVRVDREKTHPVDAEILRKIFQFIGQKISKADVVIIEDYGKGMIHAGLLKEVVRLAKKFKKPVLVDPKEKNFPHYTGVTAITPNRKEAYGALQDPKSADYSMEEVGRKLLEKLKCMAVLVTLGEDGMALFEKGKPTVKIPTFAREVYDVSGAGDTVIAVFALALAAGSSMKEAAKLSNIAAGIVVGKLGTATVSPEELREAVEKRV